MSRIFDGIKVIDLTKVFSGPFATRMLADYGAEVLKIETDENFDDSRNFSPIKNNWSGYFETLNRNKKGINLNLKDPKDLEKLYKLVESADIFVENLTPSTKFKLKVDYQTLKKINPKIIYASLSGLGQKNDRKYYDVIAQAESGLISLTGDKEQPVKIGPSVVDAFSGMTLAFGISSALFYRQKTGKGQYLDVSMLSCAMNLLENNLIEYSITKQNPVPSFTQDSAISPFGIFKAKDGDIVIAVGNENLWSTFSEFLKFHINFEENNFSSNNLRLKNNNQLTKIIENVTKEYLIKDLVIKLTDIKIPCTKVNKMSDVYQEEDNFKEGRLVNFQHSMLGSCTVPGSSINFSENENENLKIEEAPRLGKDNKEYGL